MSLNENTERCEDVEPNTGMRCLLGKGHGGQHSVIYNLNEQTRANEIEKELIALTDFDRACAKSKELEIAALPLAEGYSWTEVKTIFRLIAVEEITTGDFLRKFSKAVSQADLENFVLLLPTCYKLLAKYPQILEQYKTMRERTQ